MNFDLLITNAGLLDVSNTTEEATKNALVMPFIQGLGYNVFDPHEVIPEYTADFATKKGSKVDYVIQLNDTPAILIECKCIGAKLNVKNESQLANYFHHTSARFAILTNGEDYKFYSDIQDTNKMDIEPFFEFSIHQADRSVITQLEKFSKENFNLENILADASELNYQRQISDILRKELESPSEDFVKIVASKVYQGRFTGAISDKFAPLVKKGFNDLVKEILTSRIDSAFAGTATSIVTSNKEVTAETEAEEDKDDGIVTTMEEVDGYNIVRAILSKEFCPSRIIMRDTQSYCSVLLDDNNRKPICRLHFNNSGRKQIMFFKMENGKRTELEKLSLENVHEIYSYSETVLNSARSYN